jgi:hypothetical protein
MKRNLTTAISQRLGYAKPLLGKLVKWTVWAVLGLTIVIIILYVAGSYRQVSDTAQLALVRFGLIVSLLLVISSMYGFVLDIFYAIHRKSLNYVAGALGYVLVMAIGALIALSLAFIISAAGGNR